MGEEGPHIARRQRQQRLHLGRTAEMMSEKEKELAKVAPVGLDRVGRQFTLSRKIRKSCVHRRTHVRSGADPD